jgi:hypothetical protein
LADFVHLDQFASILLTTGDEVWWLLQLGLKMLSQQQGELRQGCWQLQAAAEPVHALAAAAAVGGCCM